jgi:hypothetical protein
VKRVVSILVVAGALAGTAAAADYRGIARALMPTPKEVAYTQLLQFTKAQKPSGSLAKGFKAGVAALYRRGTTKAPVEAAATVYVYTNAARAKSAWQHTCVKCSHLTAKGIQMRFAASKSGSVTVVQTYTVCRNVFVNAVTQGADTAAKLAQDAGAISLAVYRRATHFGMSACK